ncbi:MAG TPA: 4Fe-4S dicluster domain-containing protein [Acidimicrobiia bacterium]|nr:4Fe-4S dicluster domain-containing protein [Acidimicrobiia bacterium]
MITTAVLICRDLLGPSMLDPLSLAETLGAAQDRVAVIDRLCAAPASAGRAVARLGARRAVVAVCDHGAQLETLAARLGRSGLDPLGMEPIVLGPVLAGDDGVSRAGRLVRAGLARLDAGPRDDPATTRLRFADGPVDRRALLTLPPVRYTPVAAVDETTCVGTERCGHCVTICPFSAITTTEGRARVERTSCASCGLCLSACPASAITLPGASLAEHEAGLLAADIEGNALAFVCERAAARLAYDEIPPPWLPIEVPCAGMVTPGWILQGFAAGAGDVAVVACGEDCRCSAAVQVDAAVEIARDALALTGIDRDRVHTSRTDRRDALGVFAEPVAEAIAGIVPGPVVLREPLATTSAVTAIASALGTGSDTQLETRRTPSIGIVDASATACTLCGACPTACPTGALRLDEDQGTSRLEFDPARCWACSSCISICPESALTLRPGIDLAALLVGPTALVEDTIARCARCDAPIGPRSMLERVVALIDDDNAMLRVAVTERCVDCRGLVGPSSLP